MQQKISSLRQWFCCCCLYFIMASLSLQSNQPTKPLSLICLLTTLEIPLPLQQLNFPSSVKLASASPSIIWSWKEQLQSKLAIARDASPPSFLQCVIQCWVVWGFGGGSIPADPRCCDERKKPNKTPLYQSSFCRWNSTGRWIDAQFQ